jgi:hypothetical protein
MHIGQVFNEIEVNSAIKEKPTFCSSRFKLRLYAVCKRTVAIGLQKVPEGETLKFDSMPWLAWGKTKN